MSNHEHQPLIDDTETDVRFAIDDDETTTTQQASSDTLTNQKYPPLPPTYNDTVKVDSQLKKWNPKSWFTLSRTTREHIQGCFPNYYNRRRESDSHQCSVSSCCVKAVRWLPANRFIQASILIFGLWVLVMFTGTDFYDNHNTATPSPSEHLHQGWDYSHLPPNPPAPLVQDGTVVERAQWKWRGCASSRAGSARVVCTENTFFYLNPNKGPNGFASTDSIFLNVDPIRPDRVQPVGTVPSVVHVIQLDSTNRDKQLAKGMVKIDITAQYDKEYKVLFEKSLVAKTNRGFYDEGVEILTYVKAGSIPDSPLTFDIKVWIPPNTNIPALHLDAGSSNFEILDNSDGKATADLFFGKMIANTQVGNIHTASLSAVAEISLTSATGNIKVDGHLEAASIKLDTNNGQISLRPKSSVEAAYDAKLHTNNGLISLDKDAFVRATMMQVQTDNGRILASTGTLFANHSLVLRTSNGNVDVNVAVEKPNLSRLDGGGGYPGLVKTEVVRVDVSSQTGGVNVNYTSHAVGVPLESHVTSQIGSLHVTHSPEFQGIWQVRGTSLSRIDGAGTKDGFHLGDRIKRFQVTHEVSGWVYRELRGKSYYQGDQIHPQAQSQVRSEIGLATLTFN